MISSQIFHQSNGTVEDGNLSNKELGEHDSQEDEGWDKVLKSRSTHVKFQQRVSICEVPLPPFVFCRCFGKPCVKIALLMVESFLRFWQEKTRSENK